MWPGSLIRSIRLDELMDGRLTPHDAFRGALVEAGRPSGPAAVAALVEADRQLIHAHATLHDDALPFLAGRRAAGERVVLVSNCGASTRSLLERLGVLAAVDDAVLSCEVGSAKPAAPIYAEALGRLGAAAADAVLVDDQQRFCLGARAVGIGAVRIARGDGADLAPADGVRVVRSLAELV